MRPIRIRIENFIGLSNVNISFEDKELFVIQGPNGSGKSSLLEAIYFALFGKTLRHGGKYKREEVVNKASSIGRALVELEFSHQGKRWRVKREILRSKDTGAAYLECLDDGEKVQGNSEVSKRISKILGFTDDTFKTTVLLPQGKITSFLELSSTERMRVLKDLLGGEKVYRIAELVKFDLREMEGNLNALKAQIGAIDLEGLRKEKESLVRKISDLEIELSKIVERINSLSEELRRDRERERLLRDLALEKELLNKAESRKAELFRELHELDEALKEDGAKIRGLESDLKVAEEVLIREEKLLNRFRSISLEVSPLRAEIRSLEKDIKAKREKVNHFKVDIDRIGSEVAKLRKEYESLERELEEVENDYERKRTGYMVVELKKRLKVGDVCPICGSIVVKVNHGAIESSLAELSSLREARDRIRKELEKKRGLISSKDKEREEKERQRNELLSEIEDKERSIKEKEKKISELLELFGLKEEEIDRALSEQDTKVKNIREKVSELKQSLSRLEESRKSKIRERERISLELGRLEEEVKLRRDKISEMELREGIGLSLDEVNRQIELKEKELERLRAFERSIGEELSVSKERLKFVDEKIENHAILERKIRELTDEVSLLSKLNETLYDSNFPKFLLSQYLMDAARIANDYYLPKLSRSRYSIEATVDFDLRVLDNDLAKEERDIKELSGGEKVLISFALALGIAEVLAGGLEAFFIDEGFSPLDRENLGIVAHELLGLEGKGKLIGIITHDPLFADYFPVKLKVEGGRASWV